MLVHIEISLKPPNSNWGDEVWMVIGKAMMAILCYRRNVNAAHYRASSSAPDIWLSSDF